MSQDPGHKQAWCAAFTVRMRFKGWPEDLCDVAWVYINAVRRRYTGYAWRSYTQACDVWLERLPPGIGTLRVIPRRSDVGVNIDILIFEQQKDHTP